MTTIVIRPLDAMLARYGNALGAIGEGQARKAMARAVNRTTDAVHTRVIRAVVRQSSIPREIVARSIIERVTAPLIDAYRAKLAAANDTDRLEAERDIARLTAARDIALAEAGRAWSATSVGRWLIVVPFGLWWAAIYLVQIVNPWLGLSLVVVDVPPRIFDMALVLVPQSSSRTPAPSSQRGSAVD